MSETVSSLSSEEDDKHYSKSMSTSIDEKTRKAALSATANEDISSSVSLTVDSEDSKEGGANIAAAVPSTSSTTKTLASGRPVSMGIEYSGEDEEELEAEEDSSVDGKKGVEPPAVVAAVPEEQDKSMLRTQRSLHGESYSMEYEEYEDEYEEEEFTETEEGEVTIASTAPRTGRRTARTARGARSARKEREEEVVVEAVPVREVISQAPDSPKPVMPASVTAKDSDSPREVRSMGPKPDSPKVVKTPMCGPMLEGSLVHAPIEVDIEDLVRICRCGQSQSYPYCDRSHVAYNEANDTSFEPWTAEYNLLGSTIYVCGCGQSVRRNEAGIPLCDYSCKPGGKDAGKDGGPPPEPVKAGPYAEVEKKHPEKPVKERAVVAPVVVEKEQERKVVSIEEVVQSKREDIRQEKELTDSGKSEEDEGEQATRGDATTTVLSAAAPMKQNQEEAGAPAQQPTGRTPRITVVDQLDETTGEEEMEDEEEEFSSEEQSSVREGKGGSVVVATKLPDPVTQVIENAPPDDSEEEVYLSAPVDAADILRAAVTEEDTSYARRAEERRIKEEEAQRKRAEERERATQAYLERKKEKERLAALEEKEMELQRKAEELEEQKRMFERQKREEEEAKRRGEEEEGRRRERERAEKRRLHEEEMRLQEIEHQQARQDKAAAREKAVHKEQQKREAEREKKARKRGAEEIQVRKEKQEMIPHASSSSSTSRYIAGNPKRGADLVPYDGGGRGVTYADDLFDSSEDPIYLEWEEGATIRSRTLNSVFSEGPEVLYCTRWDPASASARCLIAKKGIPVRVAIGYPPDASADRHVIDALPVLVCYNGAAIRGAVQIVDYLVDKYRTTGDSFIPSAPERRSRSALMANLCETYLAPLLYLYPSHTIKALVGKPPIPMSSADKESVFKDHLSRLDIIEGYVSRQGPYITGKSLCAADVLLFPFFVYYTNFCHRLRKVLWNGRPKLKAWFESISSEDTHVKKIMDDMLSGIVEKVNQKK